MTAFFGMVYVGVMLSYIYQTRVLPGGAFLVWLIFLCSWGCDTCAYCVGVLIGKHKMAPHISPNKTVEGLIGGAIGCVVLGMILSFAFKYNLAHGFFLSFIAAIMAPVGDLFESYMKRACDIKDSGNILPGHGGMMDRFDSLLFVAPSLAAVLAILN